MTTPTLRQRLTGLLATVAVLGIIIGLPALFLAIGANPIPDQAPSWESVKNALLAPDDGTLILGLFKVIGWAAWAFMTLSVVVETIARLRRVEAPKLPGLGRPQAAARGLVGLAALLFIAAPIAAQAANAGPAAASAPATEGQVQAGTVNKTPAQHGVKVEATQERATVDHSVRPGESLWSIAEDHFGDGARYNGDRRAQPQSPRLPAQLPRARLGAQAARRRTAERLRTPTPCSPTTHSATSPTTSSATPTGGRRSTRPPPASPSPAGPTSTDPDVIDVGWKLNIPDAEQPARQDDQQPAATRGQARDPSRTPRPAARRPAGRGGAPGHAGDPSARDDRT